MKYFLIISFFILGSSLVSCGKPTKIVSILSTPAQPLVWDQDFTERNKVGDEDEVVSTVYKANLIRFKLTIKNHHNKTISITGVRFTILDAENKKIIKTIGVSELLNETLDYDIKEIEPNQLLTGPTTDSPNIRAQKTKTIFLDGLPKLKEPSQFIRYNIKVEILGWVGKAEKPEARLSASYSFSTF